MREPKKLTDPPMFIGEDNEAQVASMEIIFLPYTFSELVTLIERWLETVFLVAAVW